MGNASQPSSSSSLFLGPFAPLKTGLPVGEMGFCGGCQSLPRPAALCLQSNTQERAGKKLIRNWSCLWRSQGDEPEIGEEQRHLGDRIQLEFPTGGCGLLGVIKVPEAGTALALLAKPGLNEAEALGPGAGVVFLMLESFCCYRWSSYPTFLRQE